MTTEVTSIEPEVVPAEPTPEVVPPVEPTQEPAQEPTPEPEVATEPTPEPEPEPSVISFKYEDSEMNFTVDSEAAAMLTDKGFDASSLFTELAESKDFTFSAETRAKLDEAFGKFFVDVTMKAMKADIDGVRSAHQKAADESFARVCESIGGEENWAKLEAYAATMDDAAIEQFNRAMQSGDPYFQSLAATALMAQVEPKQDTIEQQKPTLNLIQGKPVGSTGPSACSAAEFREAFTNGEYNKDPAKWDAMRRLGIAQGI